MTQEEIGNIIYYFDEETGTLLHMRPTDSYCKIKKEQTEIILSKRDEFKQRGAKVVRKDLINNWISLVDQSLDESYYVWYNGVGIEAVLQCMEILSKEDGSIEDAYNLIDIQNYNHSCVFFNMELSSMQCYGITSVIGTYHERGQEFCDFRNNKINNFKKLQRSKYRKKNIPN
ncbi:MAG: hypothetical protein IJR82_01745 [Bacilli bacterium]|nr:hypothetical protein [Bacilli bacterium]